MSAGNLVIGSPSNQTPAVGDYTISGTGSFTYDGNAKGVTVTAKDGKTSGAVTVKYNGSTTTPSAAGTYTVTFDVAAANGWNAASGLSAGTLTINPKAITFTIDAIPAQTYTGSAITPVVTVKDGSATLTQTTHYTVSYSNNTNAGTATVTVTGAGNYAGSTGSKTFTINKATPVASDYDIGNMTQTFGNVKAVTVTPKTGKSSGGRSISYEGTGGTTYTKSTTLPTNAGTYAVTFNVAAATNWNAATNLSAGTLTINAKAITFTIDAIPAQTYTGSAISPVVTVKDGSTTLTLTTHYTVTYSNNTNIGTATVTVTGTGNYAGSTGSKTFTINDDPSIPYIITGSGTSFTATRGGVIIGTANQAIQTVIDGIRTHATGKNPVIQFGDGTAVLNIGTVYVSFNNSGGTWGEITLTGKITSSTTTSTAGTITIPDAVSVTSTADISDDYGFAVYNASTGTLTISGGTVSTTRSYSNTVYNASTGTVTISGGMVSATGNNGDAVYNNGWGTVNISGGTVSATTGSTVYNRSNGTVNISGGTVSATTGVAVYNLSRGRINVSGIAKITSATPHNNTQDKATMFFQGDSYTPGERLLEMTGGTVENTCNGGMTIDIFVDTTALIGVIYGGTVKAASSNDTALIFWKGTVRVDTNAVIIGKIITN